MAQPFSFGFNSDDIDNEGGEGNEMDIEDENISVKNTPALLEPKVHGLDEMVGVFSAL